MKCHKCGTLLDEGKDGECQKCYEVFSVRITALEAALAAERGKVGKLRAALKYYGKCSGDGCWCRRGGEGHRTARLALLETANKKG